MHRERRGSPPHLTDPELFSLALPPAGEPEALPAHLSDCLACSRALFQWKTAVRELASDQAEPIESRTEEQWRAVEDRTLEALARARRARQGLPVRWAVTIAACLLLVALLLPARRSVRAGRAGTVTPAAELSGQDQADDALLRDVARLVRTEDSGGSWSSLVPEPGPARSDEERL